MGARKYYIGLSYSRSCRNYKTTIALTRGCTNHLSRTKSPLKQMSHITDSRPRVDSLVQSGPTLYIIGLQAGLREPACRIKLKVNWIDLNISGWASSWTIPLSPRPPGGSLLARPHKVSFKVSLWSSLINRIHVYLYLHLYLLDCCNFWLLNNTCLSTSFPGQHE